MLRSLTHSSGLGTLGAAFLYLEALNLHDIFQPVTKHERKKSRFKKISTFCIQCSDGRHNKRFENIRDRHSDNVYGQKTVTENLTNDISVGNQILTSSPE